MTYPKPYSIYFRGILSQDSSIWGMLSGVQCEISIIHLSDWKVNTVSPSIQGLESPEVDRIWGIWGSYYELGGFHVLCTLKGDYKVWGLVFRFWGSLHGGDPQTKVLGFSV